MISLYDATGNQLKYVKVKMKILDFFGSTIKDRPVCDTRTRSEILYTLEYFRTSEVCAINLENNEAITNDQGVASFSDARISR